MTTHTTTVAITPCPIKLPVYLDVSGLVQAGKPQITHICMTGDRTKEDVTSFLNASEIANITKSFLEDYYALASA